jgi:hypothetical protein
VWHFVTGRVLSQRAVYQAVVDNERDVHDAYERAIHRDAVAGELADILRHYGEDAHQYRAELVQTLVQRGGRDAKACRSFPCCRDTWNPSDGTTPR